MMSDLRKSEREREREREWEIGTTIGREGEIYRERERMSESKEVRVMKKMNAICRLLVEKIMKISAVDGDTFFILA